MTTMDIEALPVRNQFNSHTNTLAHWHTGHKDTTCLKPPKVFSCTAQNFSPGILLTHQQASEVNDRIVVGNPERHSTTHHMQGCHLPWADSVSVSQGLARKVNRSMAVYFQSDSIFLSFFLQTVPQYGTDRSIWNNPGLCHSDGGDCAKGTVKCS